MLGYLHAARAADAQGAIRRRDHYLAQAADASRDPVALVLARAALLPNDQVTIAHFKFRVLLGPEASAPQSPPVRVHAGEHTQALDAREVAHLLRRPSSNRDDEEGEDSGEIPGEGGHLQRNPLPDVYPDDFEPHR